MRSARLGPFVPVETKPAQAVQDAGDHVGRRSLDVGILDAQHEHAAVPAGVEPVEERRARAADVQVAGGGRGEADAQGHIRLYARGMHQHLADVLARLDWSRAALGAAVDSIPAPLRQQRPAPDRWSAAEVLEHLSIVERLFTGRMAEAIDAARAGGLAGESGDRMPLPDEVETRMANRATRRSAPEAAIPTGTFDAAAAWMARRAAAISGCGRSPRPPTAWRSAR